MKEARNILGWIGMAESNSIVDDAVLHVDEVCKSAGHLAEAVRAFVMGDLSGKTIAIENVNEAEHRADMVKNRIRSQLSEGLLMPPDREDLLRFIKNLDKIADCTNSAARLLGFIEDRLPDNVLKNMEISAALVVDSVNEIGKAIRALAKKDFSATLAACDEADRLEHRADEQKRSMIEAVIRARMDATNLLLCYNLAQSLEVITDKVGTVSDTVKILTAKSR